MGHLNNLSGKKRKNKNKNEEEAGGGGRRRKTRKTIKMRRRRKNNRNVVVVVWLYYSQRRVEINVECGVVTGSMWRRVIQTKKQNIKRVSLPSPSLICTICAPNIIEPELGH